MANLGTWRFDLNPLQQLLFLACRAPCRSVEVAIPNSLYRVPDLSIRQGRHKQTDRKSSIIGERLQSGNQGSPMTVLEKRDSCVVCALNLEKQGQLKSSSERSATSSKDSYREITRVHCQLWRNDACDRTWSGAGRHDSQLSAPQF